MTLALHDRAAGYYATRDPFGAAAISSPRRRSARCSARCSACGCVQVWHDQGSPKQHAAGRAGPRTRHPDGRCAARREAWRRNSCAELEVVLVEASPALREVQAETLQRLRRGRCAGQTQFDASSSDRPLFLRRQRVLRRPADPPICEDRARLVRAHGDAARTARSTSRWRRSPCRPPLIPASRAGAPDGGVYEVSPAGACARRTRSPASSAIQGGAALIVDYGYDGAGFRRDPAGGAPAIASPTCWPIPAKSDLSAHVDFAAPGRSGRARRRGGVRARDPGRVPGRSRHRATAPSSWRTPIPRSRERAAGRSSTG